jgi:hypothetical protein
MNSPGASVKWCTYSYILVLYVRLYMCGYSQRRRPRGPWRTRGTIYAGLAVSLGLLYSKVILVHSTFGACCTARCSAREPDPQSIWCMVYSSAYSEEIPVHCILGAWCTARHTARKSPSTVYLGHGVQLGVKQGNPDPQYIWGMVYRWAYSM